MDKDKQHISTSEEYSCPWYWVEKERIKYPTGIERDYYIVRSYNPFVGIIAFYQEKLILLKQWRPIIKDWMWEIPFGGVEEGEELECATTRELLEETGYEATSLKKVGESYAAIGFSSIKGYIFTSDQVKHIPEKAENSPIEIIEVHLVTPDEFDDMIAQGKVLDAPTLAAWSMYKAQHKDKI